MMDSSNEKQAPVQKKKRKTQTGASKISPWIVPLDESEPWSEDTGTSSWLKLVTDADVSSFAVNRLIVMEPVTGKEEWHELCTYWLAVASQIYLKGCSPETNDVIEVGQIMDLGEKHGEGVVIGILYRCHTISDLWDTGTQTLKAAPAPPERKLKICVYMEGRDTIQLVTPFVNMSTGTTKKSRSTSSTSGKVTGGGKTPKKPRRTTNDKKFTITRILSNEKICAEAMQQFKTHLRNVMVTLIEQFQAAKIPALAHVNNVSTKLKEVLAMKDAGKPWQLCSRSNTRPLRGGITEVAVADMMESLTMKLKENTALVIDNSNMNTETIVQLLNKVQQGQLEAKQVASERQAIIDAYQAQNCLYQTVGLRGIMAIGASNQEWTRNLAMLPPPGPGEGKSLVKSLQPQSVDVENINRINDLAQTIEAAGKNLKPGEEIPAEIKFMAEYLIHLQRQANGEMRESRVDRFPATTQYRWGDQRHRNTRGNRQASSHPVNQPPSSFEQYNTVEVDVVENTRGGTPTQGNQGAVKHDAGMPPDAGGLRLTEEGIKMFTDPHGQDRTG
jgi:hypothetical protein